MKSFFNHLRSLLFYLSILLLIIFSPSLHALPNQPSNNFWQPNGNVYVLTVSPNGVTYLGGDFDYVGPLTGPAVLVNPLNGLSSPSFPLIQGSIGAATSDNQGGWYIGGHFHQIGKTKFFDLAHIRSDGSLDESWRPQPYRDIQGDISVLKLVGNRLFVGGGFTFIGGKNRNYLAAFDATTGQLIDSWDAKIAKINDAWPFSEPINALEVVGDKLLVGGLFSQFGVQSRRYFAALKLENGELISDWGPKVDGPVTAIAQTSEGTIFLGGLFKKVTDSSLPNEDFPFLIALDSAGHAKSAWNSKPDAAVYALALSADQNTLFVGGEFISFGEGAGKLDRTCLASFNLNPAMFGAITSWAPSVEKKPGNPTFKNQIASLLVSQDGKTLYAGGIFKKIDQQPRSHAAAFDLTQNGRLKEISLQVGCNNSVRCVNIISQDKDHLLIGEHFFSYGGALRSKLAALGPDGKALDWIADADEPVNALALYKDDLYVGGFFSKITDRLQQDHAHQGLAKLNAKDGSVNESWKADLKTSIPMAKSSGFAFAFKGDTLYVGGKFEKVNDQDRKNLVALKVTDGSVQSQWIVDANEAVRALLIQGETVYVGGNFTEIGKDKTNQPYPRNHLAALHIDGTVKEDWIVNANQSIESLAIQENSLYIAGEFTSLSDKNGNAHPRGHLAALNAAEGTIQEGWKVSTENRVTNLLIQGNILYLAGDFRSIAIGNESTVRNFLAALTLDGKVTRWNPDANNSVYALAGENNVVLAGGLFESFFDLGSYDYISSSHLAQFQSNQTIQFKESTLRVNENAGFINLEILLSEPNTVPVQVSYKVTGGNAKSEDYQLKDGVATISDGQTQANISFQVIDNNKVDGDRMIEISLFNPLQAALGANQKLTINIVDNEQAVLADDNSKKNGTGNGGGCSIQDSAASSQAMIMILSLFLPLLLLRMKKYKRPVS